MSRKLEYIKVVGTLTEIGGYRSVSRGQRPYEMVTILDEAGAALRFKLLRVPTRLDAKINRGETATFHICRAKSGDRQTGALYALEARGQLNFYDAEAAEIARELARSSSKRVAFFSNPLGAILGLAAGVLPVVVGGANLLIPAIAWWAWILFPFVLPNAYAGLGTMRRSVQGAGPDLGAAALSKR